VRFSFSVAWISATPGGPAGPPGELSVKCFSQEKALFLCAVKNK
jgi:hypothetical protein